MRQMETVQQVDRFVHERRRTDRVLVGWGIYFFLLSWVTFGIYPSVVFYQRLARTDAFRERKIHYYDAVITATREYARRSGHEDEARAALDDLHRETRQRLAQEHHRLRPGLSLFLAWITLGIWGLVSARRLMRFWWDAQEIEQDFDERLSVIWMRLGIVDYPLHFEPVAETHRSFAAHFVLTLCTLGIFGIVWDYRLHVDPDRTYPEFHDTEDAVLSALRFAEPSRRREPVSA
ncbi:DUF4234 domain-containing protein [Streptomyces sp. SID11385]|uniref:DUF4234 domain-containing protein n=1 Tax=Streptomyces sp. SID11385 TaxID=2706031 RepID=UPI0013C80945|nr:DUF4234 domain-containing protein [Streptomyces sp. SID11385]NEA44500.1 DUF4234 domain-containing protein [Streptomyces sp. SID11385]